MTNTQNFSLDHPSVAPEWFDEYYRLYEYLEDEELLGHELCNIRPLVNDDGMPEEYRTYFYDLYEFWRAYMTVCRKHHIKPLFRQPEIPENASELQGFTNDKLLTWWKHSVRAMIHLFESRNLFLHKSAAEYLEAEANDRLDIAELEEEDDKFQLLLVMNVGLRVDLRDILQYLKDYWPKYALPKPLPDAPVNPWLAVVIAKYRAKEQDGKLRELYDKAVETEPKTPWDTFVARTALRDAVEKNPFYSVRIEDTPLSYLVKARLDVHEVGRIYDLLQVTLYELRELEGINADNVKEIKDFLAANGCRLEKGSGRDTYKVGLKEDIDERESRYREYRALLRKTDKLKKSCGEKPSLIRETVETYHSLFKLCEANRIDVKRRASALWLYCAFVVEKRAFCPDILHNFNDYATEMATHFETTYGFSSPIAADAHRDVGKWLLEIGEAQRAMLRFNLAASIYEEAGEQNNAEACRRLAEEASKKQ